MFDRISFTSFSGMYDSAIINTPKYQEFAQQHQLSNGENLSFFLDGSWKFLLGHPLAEQLRRSFLYIQSFSYMENGPSYYTERSGYSSYLLLYTYDGSGTLIYEGEKYTLKKGDGFIIDCRKPHIYQSAAQSWIHSDLHFSGGNSSELYSSLFENQSPVFHIQPESLYQNVLEELLYEHINPAEQRDCTVSLLLNQILHIVYKHPQKAENKPSSGELADLLQYLEQHFGEDISINQMTEIARISKYHLIREFKKAVGFTPHQYLIRLRLLQAEQLLLMTDIPSYKIGMLTGFSTEAAFINSFKKAFSSTPAEFRRNNKQ